MTPAAQSLARLFESPLPLAVTAAATTGVGDSASFPVAAVVICLAGGTFLLNLWLNLKKAGAYARIERQAESKADKADLVSRSELLESRRQLQAEMKEFRTELKTALDAIAREFHETTLDMTDALARLKGFHDAQQLKPRKG